jgi:hypothetical protein
MQVILFQGSKVLMEILCSMRYDFVEVYWIL